MSSVSLAVTAPCCRECAATASVSLSGSFLCGNCYFADLCRTTGVQKPPIDEKSAADGFRNGDAAAFEWLATHYMKKAAGVARAVVGGGADAEDVVQDALVRAWVQRRSFTAGRPFGPWLLQIVRNRGLDLVRHRRMAEQKLTDFGYLGATSASIDSVVHARLQTARIVNAIAGLPAMQRKVASLSLLQGLAHSEIAKLMSLREGTVRSHLTLARKRIRAALEQ